MGAVRLATDVKWRLKTKLIGNARKSAAARNLSEATLRAIERRARATRLLRGGGTRGAYHDCLHAPDWVQRMHRTPPRAEVWPLPRPCAALAAALGTTAAPAAESAEDGDAAEPTDGDAAAAAPA